MANEAHWAISNSVTTLIGNLVYCIKALLCEFIILQQTTHAQIIVYSKIYPIKHMHITSKCKFPMDHTVSYS